MQHVFTARDGMEAHFLQGLLEQEGIEAVIQGEALAQVWSEIPLTTESLPSVWVKDEDVDRSKPLIDEYRRREEASAMVEPAARPTWKCPNCGENVEEQFTACWNCRTERPGEPEAAGH